MAAKKDVTGIVPRKDVAIPPPQFQTVEFTIVGDAPYVQQRFSQKAIEQIKAVQLAGSKSKKGKAREPKDFQECYEQAKHISTEGWCGIPASSFRAAMISACRLVGFKMTLAKLSIFIPADGFDVVDGTPLIKFSKGEPRYVEHAMRIPGIGGGGTDIRPRPMWDPGWEAKVRVTFDEAQFSAEDVTNLMMRVGMQVGLGEGRPDSRSSVGMGWGTFQLK
jgi:hypothetical protein